MQKQMNTTRFRLIFQSQDGEQTYYTNVQSTVPDLREILEQPGYINAISDEYSKHGLDLVSLSYSEPHDVELFAARPIEVVKPDTRNPVPIIAVPLEVGDKDQRH